MKKWLLIFWGILFSLHVQSQNKVDEQQNVTNHVEKQSKKDIIKKGISFGPLPVVAFDQDKGLQYGGLLNIYDYGDGSHYPHPRQQLYLEVSAFTKGTQQYFLTYDTKHLIPGVRMSLAGTVVFDKAMDFYGYNGYQAVYRYEDINYWQKKKDKTGMPYEAMTAFYRLERLAASAKADFVGNILENKLFWQAGYYFSSYRYRTIDADKINKGKDEAEKFAGQTLYDKYNDWGIIPEKEKDGGLTSALRLGIMYDTRDFEAAPARGIWAEANITFAPGFLGTTHSYYRYMLAFRHYIPVVNDDFVLAYRFNYQGCIGNYLPYYIMPVFSNIGKEYDRDGIGGYRTARGIMRDRIQGLDVGFLNAELRWKFVRFHLLNQNICLGLNAFLDGGMVTRNYNVSYRGPENPAMKQDYEKYIDTSISDKFHAAAGGGLRIIINQNFIIAVDYAKPLDKRDGNGSLYVNTGYLF